MLKEVNDKIKAAMIAKDSERLTALRSLKAALVKILTDNVEITEISSEEAIKVVQKQVSQRKDSMNIYLGQSRYDLAKIEADEIIVLEEFLPEQMSHEQATLILKEIIATVGATNVKDTGKVMGLATKQLAGKIDNKTVGAIVKELLS